jgi:predicted transposase YbfD/YdcC
METFSEKPKKIALFESYFSSLKDSRRTSKGNLRHPLPEILFLTLASVISGCNTWEEIEHFGEMKLDWLRKFYPYKYGAASHDTLGAVFSSLEPSAFGKCFIEYTQSLAKLDSRVVAIDGKTVRGVASDFGNSPLHIVSAFCQENRLCLSQQKVDGKSNEITAIPLLLEMITLDGCIVTIDAMGCQKDIASKIVERNADYILQVKDNQKELHSHIERLFEITAIKDTDTNHDLGHGRIEKRICRVINDLTFLDQKQDWKGLKSVVEIESEVENKKTGKKSFSKRHYISSLEISAAEMSEAIRQHWSIENNLHWNLDVIFKEDHQMKRKGNSVENFNLITKICLGLLEAENSKKRSKNLKRHRAILSDSYREQLLNL